MTIAEILSTAGTQLTDCVVRIPAEQIDALTDTICQANRVFVYGAGRSMLMLRCLAMRLMHLGFTSYVVGDTTTPAFGEGDLLIVASGSGTTSGVVRVAEKAKSLGGSLAVLTISKESTLGKMADVLVEIPGYTDKVKVDREMPVLPGGSIFEQSVLLVGDAMVLPLSQKHHIPTDRAFSLHANLE